MAFVPVNSTEVATGQPVKRTTQEKIKENFDNHEARITNIEGGTSVNYPPIIMRVNGKYHGHLEDGILKTTPNFDITITGIRILIDKAGTAGSTEVDVLSKAGAGAWTSVLTGTVSIPYTEGNDSISSPGVLNMSNVVVRAGDLLRLDLKAAQVGATNFLVRIDFIPGA